MAEIVLGLATSHSPQLNTGPEWWPSHAERDKTNPRLFDAHGVIHRYDDLVERAPASMADEITVERWRERYDACQVGITRLGEKLAEVNPDVLIVVGDDQEEIFGHDNFPAMAVYWGDTVKSIPRKPVPNAAWSAANWAYGEVERDHPVDSDLALHLIQSLMQDEFDIAHCRMLPEGMGIGHAWGFVWRRLMEPQGLEIPVIPVLLNTYYPPNQPSPKRTWDLGSAIGKAVAGWASDARVAVLASGGLSHFVVLEDLDRDFLKALATKDADAIRSMPAPALNAGTSEIRNWIAMAAAVDHLSMDLVDYVPCYRSPAGTGCAMGFAIWE